MAQPPNNSKPPPFNPNCAPQPGYPPQQGYPPPQQGYPPPQQGYPPTQQGYPPQQGYPAQPPPYQQGAQTTYQQNVVVQPATQTSGVGTSLGGLFKSAEKALNSAGRTVQHEVDRYANTATLMMFNNGNVLRLQSKETGHFLQVLNTGALGANAGPDDPSAHFTILNIGHNLVILRSVAYPTCHIANHGGHVIGNGNGDASCKFRLHETMSGFITFESVMTRAQHIGVAATGEIKPGHLAGKDNASMFTPSVVSSPYHQQMYVQQATVTTQRTK